MPPRIGDPSRRHRHFIKEWREFRGLTQEQLAEMIGTTKTSISNIESLETGYTQDSIEALAEALGVHVSILLTRPPTESDLDPSPAPRLRRRA